MNILAIDPGKSTGWSFFIGQSMVACGHLNPDNADALRLLRIRLETSQIHAVVIELPHGGEGKASKRDLIKLAFRAGVIARSFDVQVLTYEPGTWKGSVPKDKHQPRILARLTAIELSLTRGHPHDTIDAVGLGLFYLGRIGRGG